MDLLHDETEEFILRKSINLFNDFYYFMYASSRTCSAEHNFFDKSKWSKLCLIMQSMCFKVSVIARPETLNKLISRCHLLPLKLIDTLGNRNRNEKICFQSLSYT